MKKALRVTILAISALLILILFGLHFLVPFNESNNELQEYFEEEKVNLIIHEKKYTQHDIRYIETGLNNMMDSTLLIFVHGAPGSCSDFKAFLCDSQLLSKAKMVSIDRLGYGKSQYGISEVSIEKQAEMIYFVMQNYQYRKLILVGHSYGGPIVAKVALEHPDKVHRVIMLAPLNEPESEPIFKIGNLTKWSTTKWLFPKDIRVSSDEKIAHVAELQQLLNKWKTIKVPLVHMHGKKDVLAPFSNIKFSKTHVLNKYLTTIVLDEANHFLPWSHYDEVQSCILDCIKN